MKLNSIAYLRKAEAFKLYSIGAASSSSGFSLGSIVHQQITAILLCSLPKLSHSSTLSANLQPPQRQIIYIRNCVWPTNFNYAPRAFSTQTWMLFALPQTQYIALPSKQHNRLCCLPGACIFSSFQTRIRRGRRARSLNRRLGLMLNMRSFYCIAATAS